MNINLLKKIFIVVAVIIIAAFSYRFFFTLYVSSVSPDSNNTPAISPFIDISFNKNIESVGLIEISPSPDLLDKYIIEDKKIRLILDSYSLSSEEVVITLKDIESSGGFNIDNEEITIKFADIESHELSEEALNYILEEQDVHTNANADPILQFLPSSSLNYTMNPDVTRTAEDGGDIVDINLTILLSNADSGQYRKSSIDRYTKEAMDYLVNNGINPEDYKINITIREL